MNSKDSEQSVFPGEMRLVAVKDQVSCDLSDEAVILNFEDGTYYGLDPVGALVWKLVQEPRTVAELQEAILAEFDVDRPQCEKDLQAFLQDLWARKLVKTIDQ